MVNIGRDGQSTDPRGTERNPSLMTALISSYNYPSRSKETRNTLRMTAMNITTTRWVQRRRKETKMDRTRSASERVVVMRTTVL